MTPYVRSLSKSDQTEVLRVLVTERMVCAICHQPFGKLDVGPTRVFVRHKPGNYRVPYSFGTVCFACWVAKDGCPIASDCSIGFN